MRLLFVFAVLFTSCKTYLKLQTLTPSANRVTGSSFYKTAAGFDWKQRDSFVVKEVLSGNMPRFQKLFVPVMVSVSDSVTGRKNEVTFYVMPDYLSVGSDEDWVRVPVTPMAAQRIADSLHYMLPTTKMVDAIYGAAVITPEPVPMYAFRDSTPTMYHHHLIIEGQRKGRRGLIAGIKKDVVVAGKILREGKSDRVAIYGWHKTDGKPIQPLYTGHVRWYVDYSHGIRLVMRRMKVNGKWMQYEEVVNNPALKKLFSDEEWWGDYRYSY
jgi:hypothetical protein